MFTEHTKEIELQEFIRTNVKRGRYLRLLKKGTNFLSKELAIDLGIKDRDCIKFFQDKNNLSDWYVTKSDEGLLVRFYCIGPKTRIQFNNSSLSNEFIEQFNITETSFRINVGKPIIIKGVKCFPLLTMPLETNSQ